MNKALADHHPQGPLMPPEGLEPSTNRLRDVEATGVNSSINNGLRLSANSDCQQFVNETESLNEWLSRCPIGLSVAARRRLEADLQNGIGDRENTQKLERSDSIDPELTELIDAWGDLPIHIRHAITALLRSSI